MKYLLIILSLSVSGMSYAQAPIDTAQIQMEIAERSKGVVERYYSGEASAYGTLFHPHGVYAAGTRYTVGKEKILKSLKNFDGKTNFDYEIEDHYFLLIDSVTAVLNFTIKEDDDTRWLGSETWTKIDGAWGVSYAHWAYRDLRLRYGMPPVVFNIVIGIMIVLLIMGFVLGRLFPKRLN